MRNDTFGKWSREIIKNYRRDKNDTGPTRFSEFLEWWLDGKMKGSENEHWQTYRNLVNPCAYQWDYILKLENIEEESKWLFSELNITEITYPPGNALLQQIVCVHRALTQGLTRLNRATCPFFTFDGPLSMSHKLCRTYLFEIEVNFQKLIENRQMQSLFKKQFKQFQKMCSKKF